MHSFSLNLFQLSVQILSFGGGELIKVSGMLPERGRGILLGLKGPESFTYLWWGGGLCQIAGLKSSTFLGGQIAKFAKVCVLIPD